MIFFFRIKTLINTLFIKTSMLKQPQSMEELVYFTQRTIDNGYAKVWVFKQKCPKCKKAIMGKPVEKGAVKIRAKEYVCPSCKYTVDKEEYEDTLTASVEYICPKCMVKGEMETPFKRKNVQGVLTFRFACEKCKAMIDVTKKMKQPKKKGQVVLDE
ncbi:hypothetical protein C4573_02900 [Candidatus Woesearchaeota archaeon]|nr:MAG: hypothetical protein C4573_02900 [Candidatus Woesearchaeota archaeon]